MPESSSLMALKQLAEQLGAERSRTAELAEEGKRYSQAPTVTIATSILRTTSN
jgi:hypothetical protein